MREDMENYGEAPMSVTEYRSEKTGDGSDWTPRDALIKTLRDLDSGKLENVDALVICYRERKEEGITSTGFTNASPDIHVALGLLEIVKFRLWGSE